MIQKNTNPSLRDMQSRRRARQINLSRVIRPVESAKRKVISFSNFSPTRKPKGAQDRNHHVRILMFNSAPILDISA